MKVLFLLPILYFTFLTTKVLSTIDNINHIYTHLGTKSPYRIVANKNDSPILFDGCEPVRIWMVIRHGTRYPGKKFIEKANGKLQNIKTEILSSTHSDKHLNLSDLERLNKWNLLVDIDDAKKLAHEGEEEMITLAERMQSRFPTIFSKIYSNSSYKFRFTDTQRTEQSARYFAIGLFGRKTSNSVWYPKALKRDPILRFYKLCNKWRQTIKKNPNTLTERNLFRDNVEVKNILKKISTKVGIERTLTFDEVHTMYMTCAFETSWFKNSPSPWCIPFTNETIKVMEYSEDLKYYWVDGYGYKLTYVQACPAIKNLAEFFKRKEEYPKVVLYFTHSGTMLKLLAHFGLYKDTENLMHDNFAKNEHRLWKVSKIDAFGSNIAVIKYRCESTEKILVLHQERIVKILGCNESDLCDFDTFLNAYNSSINNCNFDEMCTI